MIDGLTTAETARILPRPKALRLVAEDIPEDLKRLNQWVTLQI
jgi:hypothetical protein